MRLQKVQKKGIVYISYITGLLLAIMPLPPFLESGRPLWLPLVVIFWGLYDSYKVSLFEVWFVGLILDLLYDSLLGQNALILSAIAFFVLLFSQRLKFYPVWKICLIVFFLLVVTQLIHLWVSVLSGVRFHDFYFLVPALISTIFLPVVFAIMKYFTSKIDV